MHGRVAVVTEGQIAELQLRVHDSAQNTADHNNAISTADINSRSTTDSRRIDGEMDAGGCEYPA